MFYKYAFGRKAVNLDGLVSGNSSQSLLCRANKHLLAVSSLWSKFNYDHAEFMRQPFCDAGAWCIHAINVISCHKFSCNIGSCLHIGSYTACMKLLKNEYSPALHTQCSMANRENVSRKMISHCLRSCTFTSMLCSDVGLCNWYTRNFHFILCDLGANMSMIWNEMLPHCGVQLRVYY